MFIINDHDLSGTIPTRIGHLTELVTFNLANNKDMFGSIPTEIGNLEKIGERFVTTSYFVEVVDCHFAFLISLKIEHA